MKHATKKIIEIKIDDSVVQVELDQAIIDFYKKETGRNRVTTKGLSRFFNGLIRIFNHD